MLKCYNICSRQANFAVIRAFVSGSLKHAGLQGAAGIKCDVKVGIINLHIKSSPYSFIKTWKWLPRFIGN